MSLNYGGSQWDALAIRWATDRVPEDEQQKLYDQMNRAERRRFAKLLEKVEEKKLHTAESFVTKRQMVGYMSMLIESKMMPVAANVDANDARLRYLELPFYRKWWVQLLKRWIVLNQWLDRHGIRLVKLQPEADDAESASDAGSGAQREEHEGVAGRGGQAEGAPAEPGLHGGSGQPRGVAGISEGESGAEGNGSYASAFRARTRSGGSEEEGGEGEEEAREEEGLIRVVSR